MARLSEEQIHELLWEASEFEDLSRSELDEYEAHLRSLR